MIKTFEQYTNTEKLDQKLVALLYDKIIKNKKIINGYVIDFDNFSGIIEWYNGKYVIYATPYWEYDNKLPIDVTNVNGESIYFRSIYFNKLKDEKDVNDFIEIYYNIMTEILENVDKRIEIIEILKKIKKINNINITINNKKYNYLEANNISLNDIIYHGILTDDIIKIYSEIKNNYPELISSIKYNI